MGLLRHNARANLESEGTAGEQASGVCCPNGHPLVGVPAEHEDYLCNVCDGFDEEIEIGDTVHCCRACDFDLCDSCYQAGSGLISKDLPKWFQVQCCNNQTVTTEVFFDREGEGKLMVEPLDFTDDMGVENCLAKCEPALGFPTILVVADCTYDHELHESLVTRICEFGEAAKQRGLPSCTLLLLHDPRTKEIDDHLMDTLGKHGIQYAREDTSSLTNMHERSGMMMLLRAELLNR